MSNAQLLFLNSSDSIKFGDTPSDVSYSLNFGTGNDMSGYAIAIQSMSFVNLVYPINSNNNKIYLSEDGGASITCTLTENNYTGSEMATELASVLNACSAASGLSRTYAATYDTQSKKITMTESVGLPNTFEFTAGSYDAYYELGINPGQGVRSTSYVFDYPVNLLGTKFVDIQADIGSRNYSSNGKSNILDRVPLNASFGALVLYQNSTDDYIQLNEDNINTLEIRLLDDKGYLWSLPNNCQISTVLKLSQFL